MKPLLLVAVLCLLASCNFEKTADKKFGDQHFKSAVALIELDRLRHGSYPESLDALTFTGDWDQIALHSVSYKRLAEGYELDIVNGWIGEPELEYPAEFWINLGIRKTNVGRKAS